MIRRLFFYIYNSIYFLITAKKEIENIKEENELLKKELIYSNKLIVSLIKKRDEYYDLKTIQILRKELLISDTRNAGLLKRINDLREELQKKDNILAIKEELKQLKIEYSILNKNFENSKIESSNATMILKHANERNYILQERYKLLKLELEENKIINNNICSICCENIIDISCVPCGHTYCEKCIRVPENNNCYICRQNFYRIIRIYI